MSDAEPVAKRRKTDAVGDKKTSVQDTLKYNQTDVFGSIETRHGCTYIKLDHNRPLMTVADHHGVTGFRSTQFINIAFPVTPWAHMPVFPDNPSPSCVVGAWASAVYALTQTRATAIRSNCCIGCMSAAHQYACSISDATMDELDSVLQTESTTTTIHTCNHACSARTVMMNGDRALVKTRFSAQVSVIQLNKASSSLNWKHVTCDTIRFVCPTNRLGDQRLCDQTAELIQKVGTYVTSRTGHPPVLEIVSSNPHNLTISRCSKYKTTDCDCSLVSCVPPTTIYLPCKLNLTVRLVNRYGDYVTYGVPEARWRIKTLRDLLPDTLVNAFIAVIDNTD